MRGDMPIIACPGHVHLSYPGTSRFSIKIVVVRHESSADALLRFSLVADIITEWMLGSGNTSAKHDSMARRHVFGVGYEAIMFRCR